jgi:hypothetical protein
VSVCIGLRSYHCDQSQQRQKASVKACECLTAEDALVARAAELLTSKVGPFPLQGFLGRSDQCVGG